MSLARTVDDDVASASRKTHAEDFIAYSYHLMGHIAHISSQ